MSDFWNGWKITNEQATAIKNGDKEARNRFYIDNLARIRKMAINYSHRNPKCGGLYEDMTQGIVCDIPLFDFTNGASVSRSVYKSFFYAPYGGWFYCADNMKCRLHGYYTPDDVLSLEAPLGSGKSRKQDEAHGTLYDLIADTYEAPAIDKEDTFELCNEIASPYLTPKQKEFLRLRLAGVAPFMSAELLGIKHYFPMWDRLRKNLVRNYSAIVDELNLNGVYIPEYAKQVPADFAKAFVKYELTAEQKAKYSAKKRGYYSKMTPEQKAKEVERKRLWRERKRAEKQAQSPA